jgi:hypothetical protein
MAAQPSDNLGPVTDSNHSYRIILAGFGIVGSLAALFILHPEAIAENVVTGVIGGILGFLAGRKK